MPRAATASDVFNAVAEPQPRTILSLPITERRVSGIVSTLGVAQPSVWKHLRVLRDVGLVHMRKEGRHVVRNDGRSAVESR